MLQSQHLCDRCRSTFCTRQHFKPSSTSSDGTGELCVSISSPSCSISYSASGVLCGAADALCLSKALALM